MMLWWNLWIRFKMRLIRNCRSREGRRAGKRKASQLVGKGYRSINKLRPVDNSRNNKKVRKKKRIRGDGHMLFRMVISQMVKNLIAKHKIKKTYLKWKRPNMISYSMKLL